jgi:hypothetical protein
VRVLLCVITCACALLCRHVCVCYAVSSCVCALLCIHVFVCCATVCKHVRSRVRVLRHTYTKVYVLM